MSIFEYNPGWSVLLKMKEINELERISLNAFNASKITIFILN